MPTALHRRTLVGGLGTVLVAGCLSDDIADDQSEQDDGHQDGSDAQPNTDDGSDADGDDVDAGPDECDLQTRTRQGEAEQIETTAVIGQADDVERGCARAAAEAALDQLDDQFDLDLTDPQTYWISAFPQRDGGGYRAEISIVAEKSSEETGDGSYHVCPPSAFDFLEAIDAVPRAVTVTLEFEDDEFECAHEVWVTQERRQLD